MKILIKNENASNNASNSQNDSMCIVLSPIPKDEIKLARLSDQVDECTRQMGFEQSIHVALKLSFEPSSCYQDQSFLQQLIIDNPFLDFIIFPKLQYFLKQKESFETHLRWFKANKVQIYFHDKNVKMFDNNFRLTSDFKSYLN
jgi:hypothetical protein